MSKSSDLNKSGKVSGGYSNHLTYLKEVRKVSKANGAIFTVTGYELDDDARETAKNAGIFLWTEKNLAYYEALVDAIGHYAKYEIISTLGIETKESKKQIVIPAIQIEQPAAPGGTPLYMFSMKAEDLLKTCTVFRRANTDAEAYQRMVAKKRLSAIRDFVSHQDALLPTNIVVALNPNSVSKLDLAKGKQTTAEGKPITFSEPLQEVVALQIPLAYGSMELLDGQHRLFGFATADYLTRENFHLAVTGVQGLTSDRKRDTFVAINDNARRMDPNLVALLRYEPDEAICQKDPALMAIRVAVDLTEHNPFKNKVRLLDMGKQVLTLKGISGYDLKGLFAIRGALRKALPNNLSKEYVSYLAKYFSLLKQEFPTEWNNPEMYILATNRGISAFLKLLKSILKDENYSTDAAAAQKYFKALSKFDWEFSKLKSAYVGSQGWKGFYTDLVKEIRKKYPKFAS